MPKTEADLLAWIDSVLAAELGQELASTVREAWRILKDRHPFLRLPSVEVCDRSAHMTWRSNGEVHGLEVAVGEITWFVRRHGVSEGGEVPLLDLLPHRFWGSLGVHVVREVTRPSWLPLRCGLVLLLRGGAMRFVGETIREALARARWRSCGRGMRW